MGRVGLSSGELLFGLLVKDYNGLSMATPSTASKDTAAQWGKTSDLTGGGVTPLGWTEAADAGHEYFRHPLSSLRNN